MTKQIILLLALCFFLFSCGPDWSNPDETISLIPAIKEWIVDDPVKLNFTMLGSDSSQLQFNEQYSSYYSGGSATQSGFFSSYHVVSHDVYGQGFSVNGNGSVFLLHMEPSTNHDKGNMLDMTLFKSRWSYDFTFQRMDRVSLTSKGTDNLKWMNDKINSSLQLLDTITINAVVCDSVMHFVLNDFNENFTDSTVTELFYAKHIGLVKFVQNGGVEYERVWSE